VRRDSFGLNPLLPWIFRVSVVTVSIVTKTCENLRLVVACLVVTAAVGLALVLG
jgi:hypothetical protein